MSLALLNLAEKQDPESRSKLAGQLADMFLNTIEPHTETEETLFVDILVGLIEEIDRPTQISLAERFADAASTPQPLARQMALSDEHIATPLLERSNVLTEDDLVDVASQKTEQHLVAITRRSEVPESVTDKIIERDLEKPIILATRNLGARFSDEGFGKLIDKTEAGVHDIAEALSFRTDIPEDQVDRLLENLPPAAKVRFLSIMQKDESKAAEMVAKATEATTAAMRSKSAAHMEATSLVEEIRSGSRKVDSTLIELAQDKRSLPVCQIIADMCGLEASYAQGVLRDKDSTAFVILCRANKISPEAFRALFAMRGELLRKRYDLDKSVEDYLLIDEDLAAHTLKHLQELQTR